MSNKWIRTGLTWIGVAIALVAAFVAGLFVYVTATARPLHPDPRAVPSVTQSLPAPQWSQPMMRAEQLVRSSLTEQNLPGLSVAIGIGGEMVWAEGFGYADLEKRAPVTPHTRFRIGDVSDTLTTVLRYLTQQKVRSTEERVRAPGVASATS